MGIWAQICPDMPTLYQLNSFGDDPVVSNAFTVLMSTKLSKVPNRFGQMKSFAFCDSKRPMGWEPGYFLGMTHQQGGHLKKAFRNSEPLRVHCFGQEYNV